MTPTPSSQPDSGRVRLPYERAGVDSAVGSILAAAGRHGYTDASKFALRLAVEEAMANAHRHGHRGKPDDAPILLEFRVTDREAVVTVEDTGPGFDPAGVPDPTLEENLERPSGRGLMLMRAYMTSVTFNERGNRVTLVYRRPAGRA
ncbi:MAG: ATP-binding protein [Phycisphaerales bacterium]|nr:ATP-binding protein [Phycisphaerales bacterium]